ncbi:hypothetical protein EPO04_03990 [Patescibacteria group bacterium]|nr:MAG: hypothetical protein EPO04_03990 [Patescibacteria group bacterium]
MRVRKTMVAAGAATVIGLGSMVGVASAQTSTTGTSLVDKISQRFNVDKNEVQKVFDEDHTAREAEREQRYEQRLTQAVKDGKLTEDQKAKILAKHKELEAQMEQKRGSMKAERDAMDGKTEAERQQLMEQRKAEMDKLKSDIEAWEKANGIPTGYLMMGGPGGGMRGHGGPGGANL